MLKTKKDRKLTKQEKLHALITKAFSVLEHDSAEEEPEHIASHSILLREFARILEWKIKENL